jgi:prepilin-type processing-associated H-X9-DG protein
VTAFTPETREFPARTSTGAFTLIEALVSVSIIAIMFALGSVGFTKVIKSGEKAAEMQAAKSLIAAYNSAAAENNGQFLPGYDRTVQSVSWKEGRSITGGPPPNRYPFRLAEYMNYDLDGAILTSANKKKIDKDDIYSISCFPAFGINYYYVGGDISAAGKLSFPKDVVLNQSKASGILAFATAGYGALNDKDRIGGYCILTPPQAFSSLWNTKKWSEESDPSQDYGGVDARYNGQAICAFLDGSVRALTIEELRDMRLWNRNAKLANNPNYMATPESGGGRGGR